MTEFVENVDTIREFYERFLKGSHRVHEDHVRILLEEIDRLEALTHD